MSSFPAQRLGLKNKGLILNNFDADVIVFDETTSGLDSENELKFLDIVKNNFSKSLVLMISHRDTSKDIASKIINFPC